MCTPKDSPLLSALCATEAPARIKFIERDSEHCVDERGTRSAPKECASVASASQISLPGNSCQSQSVPPQIRRMRADVVPEVRYQLRSGSYVNATISGRVCRGLADHGAQSNEHGREVGGIVVGHWHEQRGPDGESEHSLTLTDLIPVASFDSSSAHISFTERDWVRAEEEFVQKYAPAHKIRLGWYHTHPLQGIFFSEKDQNAHAMFSEPYQFALVIDPLRMEAGWFYWKSHEDRILAGPICFGLIRARK
jgi:proteasome lid subunit RPN8/RPN11